MSNKQTSIEFILNKLDELGLLDKGNVMTNLFEQAKAMHKEEIIKAAIYEPFLGNYHREVGEEYYEDEFGENQE